MSVSGFTSTRVSGVPNTARARGPRAPTSRTVASPGGRAGGAGGSSNATRRLAAKAERTNSRASSASTVGAGAVTFSVIAASDGARPTRPRDERVGFSDGRDSYASGVSEDVALDTPSPASVTDVAEKSPPAHVAGFHTTTPPQPGTSNAAAVPAASSLSSRDSSASGHLSLGGTYATRCVGGASVSTGDVSTFHEDVSTKKGSSARGTTNARAGVHRALARRARDGVPKHLALDVQGHGASQR